MTLTQVRPEDACLVVLCLVAATTDARSRRIPNLLTGPSVLAGLGLALATGSAGGIGGALTGAAAAFAIFFPMFALGGMKAGDGKLMIAIGALKGPSFLLPAVLLSSIAMAAEAVAFLLWKARDFGGPLPFLMLMAQEHKQGLELDKRTTVVWVPYGVGIAAGTLVALVTGWTPLAG